MTNRDEIVVDLIAMLEKAKRPVTKECCIYRVPPDIRGVKEDAYTPHVVSIGPFHHNAHPRLKSTETLKLTYCNSFLQRTETSLVSWIRCIDDVLSSNFLKCEFRKCYSDTLEFTKEQLTKIIFVDSAFIFELFLTYYFNGGEIQRDDWFLSTPGLENTVTKDLLMLENQLPFFVLERLFDLSFPSKSDHTLSLRQLTLRYFGFFNRSNLSVNDIDGIRHFTDLIRTFHLQHPRENRPPRTNKTGVMCLPSATELSEAGVIFKVKPPSTSLLDLTFSGQIFEIPKLEVYDETELLFRNIVALEQCHYPFETYITDYVRLLDFLVNTSKDVDILVDKGVLANFAGDPGSVANHFNGVLKNTVILGCNDKYTKVYQDLNAFYKDRWNKWMSTLLRDYCSNPWQIAATGAAFALLIMTLVQTVCSILQLKQE